MKTKELFHLSHATHHAAKFLREMTEKAKQDGWTEAANILKAHTDQLQSTSSLAGGLADYKASAEAK